MHGRTPAHVVAAGIATLLLSTAFPVSGGHVGSDGGSCMAETLGLSLDMRKEPDLSFGGAHVECDISIPQCHEEPCHQYLVQAKLEVVKDSGAFATELIIASHLAGDEDPLCSSIVLPGIGSSSCTGTSSDDPHPFQQHPYTGIDLTCAGYVNGEQAASVNVGSIRITCTRIPYTG